MERMVCHILTIRKSLWTETSRCVYGLHVVILTNKHDTRQFTARHIMFKLQDVIGQKHAFVFIKHVAINKKGEKRKSLCVP